MRFRSFLICLLALGLAFSAIDSADAKDKGGKQSGKKVHVGNKPGTGPKTIPPGQIKRYTRGAKLPVGLDYVDIRDLSKWKLKPPGRGNRYIRVGDEILEVTEDLTTVVNAVGIVGDLLR